MTPHLMMMAQGRHLLNMFNELPLFTTSIIVLNGYRISILVLLSPACTSHILSFVTWLLVTIGK
jgi:hypothetical protein